MHEGEFNYNLIARIGSQLNNYVGLGTGFMSWPRPSSPGIQSPSQQGFDQDD